jgi:hypothetical protein
MKRFLLWAVVCLCATMAQATVTVTANLKTLGQSNVTSGVVARLELKGCATNIPRVIGTGLVVSPSQDFNPNSVTGIVSMTVWENSALTCGTTTGGTSYDFTIVRFGNVVYRANYIFTVSGDISSMNPTTSVPIVPPPTGDNTYLRLDGSNAGISQVAFRNVSNNWSAAQSFKILNTTRFADQYAGADASIKINACLADVLAAGGGTCDASGLGGVQTISQEIDVSARSIGAGQWVALKLPAYGTWDSTMSNPTGCVIKQFDHSSIPDRAADRASRW